ncbi:Hypothetical Protein FCC1311_074212 [Hondaea fermentalgiana]|uniref:Uncharacterized protein n=1 Tax=Hondaea fermentalgiana TaxID=2315210 RepID=A0A2R5GJZ0_9STRA|nr:Hypothetical Protein FCC1311_074212 [Hondaea fermentalgiana]|eukprot:GBG31200.1 Hypothetical Protein FCC1311_074212 [Hondaea fermentalgiana]
MNHDAAEGNVAEASLLRLDDILRTVHEGRQDAEDVSFANGSSDGTSDGISGLSGTSDEKRRTEEAETLVRRESQAGEMDEILESLAVDAFLCLASLLLHAVQSRRREALQLLFSLAQALSDQTVDERHFSRASQALDVGSTIFAGVKTAFDILSPCFAQLSTLAVPPLEALLVHPSEDMRMLSVSIMCSFFTCASAETTMVKTDATGALARLHMVYGDAASKNGANFMQGAVGTDSAARLRCVQVESLEKSVVLVSMIEIIKYGKSTPTPNTLFRVLRSIVSKTQHLPEEKLAARGCVHHLAVELVKVERETDIFKALVAVVSNALPAVTQGDFAMHCELCLKAFEQTTRSKELVAGFLADMENFLLAPQPAVRYGATLCIHAVLSAFPADLIRAQDTMLFPLLLSASLDVKPCQTLSIECLKLAVDLTSASQGSRRKNNQLGLSGDDARELRIRRRFHADLCSWETAVYERVGKASSVEEERAQLRAVLSRGISLCAGFLEKPFAQLSAGLHYLPRVERLHRMEVLLLWARKLHHTIPFVANNLLMGIRGADSRTGTLAVKIFEAMAPTLSASLQSRDPAQPLAENVYFRSLCAIDTVFRQVLATSQQERLLKRILQTVAALPYEYFDERRLRSLCRVLATKAFECPQRTRLAIYALFGECKRFWTTPSLREYALATLLTCAGDQSAVAAQALATSLEELIKIEDEPHQGDIRDFAAVLRVALRRSLLQYRLGPYALLVRTLQLPQHASTRRIFLSHSFFRANASVSAFQTETQPGHWSLYAAFMFAQLGSAEDEARASALFTHCMQTRVEHERLLAVETYAKCLHQKNRGVPTAMLQRLAIDAFRAMRAHGARGSGGARASLVNEVGGEVGGRRNAALLSSLLQVLTRLVPLQVEGLASVLVRFFLAGATDLASRETTETEVRVACIGLVTVLLKARPLEATPVAFVLRDTLHAMISSSRQDLVNVALGAYPLVFELTSQTRDDAQVAFEFLRSDLSQFEASEANETKEENDLADVSAALSNGIEETPSLQVGKRQAQTLTKASLRALGTQVDLVQYHFFQFVQDTHSSLCAILLLGELGIRVFDLEEAEYAGEPQIKSNRLRGMLAALLLDSSASQELDVHIDRPQRKASAMALRLIGTHAPAKVLPFVVGNLCQLHELGLGHLTLLQQIFRIFETSLGERNETGSEVAKSKPQAKPELAELIPSADAKALTGLLLRSIQSSSSPIEERRAALELVAQTAVLASEQELSMTVRSILDVLESNSDAGIHQVSQEQLSRVFATFANDHPLVTSLVEHVESGLVSCEVNKRQRSFTLLSIAGKRMGPTMVLPNLIRALCDPSDKICRLAVQSILCEPPEFMLRDEIFVQEVRQLANDLELEKAAALRRRHADEDPLRSEKRTMTGSPDDQQPSHANASESLAESPRGGKLLGALEDDDPLNLNFLQADPTYLHYLAQYGLTAPAVASRSSREIPASPDESKASLRAEGTSNAFGLQESAFRGLLSCELGRIAQILASRHAEVGERLLNAIRSDIKTGEQLVERCKEHLAGISSDDLISEYLGYGELEMDQLLHSFTVNANILFACDTLPANWTDILPPMHDLFAQCEEIARDSRLLASAKMNLGSLLGSEKLHLPVVSESEFDSLEKQRANLLAQLGTEKQHKIINSRREALQRQLKRLSSHLWVMAKLQGILLDGLGVVYNRANTLNDDDVAEGLRWLLEQLSKSEHRELRSITSHAIVGLSSSSRRKSEFQTFLDENVAGVHEALQQSRPDSNVEDNLHRAKVELLETFVRLLPRCSTAVARKLIRNAFKLLLAFWDDRDSEVRRVAISLTEELGRCVGGLPELRYVLFDRNGLNLRDEVAKRTADPTCPDTDHLARLMDWAEQLASADSSSSSSRQS